MILSSGLEDIYIRLYHCSGPWPGGRYSRRNVGRMHSEHFPVMLRA